jgi:hypothetical protein
MNFENVDEDDEVKVCSVAYKKAKLDVTNSRKRLEEAVLQKLCLNVCKKCDGLAFATVKVTYEGAWDFSFSYIHQIQTVSFSFVFDVGSEKREFASLGKTKKKHGEILIQEVKTNIKQRLCIRKCQKRFYDSVEDVCIKQIANFLKKFYDQECFDDLNYSRFVHEFNEQVDQDEDKLTVYKNKKNP